MGLLSRKHRKHRADRFERRQEVKMTWHLMNQVNQGRATYSTSRAIRWGPSALAAAVPKCLELDAVNRIVADYLAHRNP